MATQFTDAQLRALAIIPKVTSSLSILGSGYIALKVFLCPDRRSKLHHRLLGSMSVFDVLSSVAYFCSTWAMPAAVSPFPFSSGTAATCSAQGFFIQLGHTVLIYNAFLAVFYALVVRENSSFKFALGRRAEIIMHLVAVAFPTLGGILAIADGAMNVAGPVGCWIQSVPPGCSGSSCVRGGNAALYRYVFAFFPTLASLFAGTVAYVLTYRTARRRRAMTRGRNDAQSRLEDTLLRLVAVQSALYLGACYFVWGIPLALRWYQTVSGKLYFGMLVFFATVMPLQGVFNVVVYVRPTAMGRRQSTAQGLMNPMRSSEFKNASDHGEGVHVGLDSEDSGGEMPGAGSSPGRPVRQGAESWIDGLSETLEVNQLQATQRI